MNNKQRIIYGIIITFVVFTMGISSRWLLKYLLGSPAHFSLSHSTMLILSLIVISIFKGEVNYKISFPKFKRIFKPIIFAILAMIITNSIMLSITKLLGAKPEEHFAIKTMTPMQIFIFIFIYASIVEEVLFRGFLMNFLSPLKTKKITILKRNISLPVILAAFLFGLSHLILITSGAGIFFLIRVVVFTTTLGIVAGYYQEKYDNNIYAIITHMSANFVGFMGSLLMSLN